MDPLRRPVMPAPETTAVGRRILDAGSRLFYERGITATGVDLVCEEAETTKRTLYQRFGSKDGLVAAYLAGRAHDWQTHLLEGLDGITDPDDRVAEVFAIARERASTHRRGCAFVNAWAELGDHAGAAADVVREEKDWMRALLTDLTGSEQRGAIVHQLYEGAQVCATIEGDLSAFDRAAQGSAALGSI
ncbi:TetR/AcrR family transcriptional regulator [Arsenicicoccus sp. UBA7492]|uniref:TetR/AcrR family transcriptional regulator n=1 Tax=Arsenicicoccus sp. UBA7492 TaxID=1946057 RepID=UPI00257FCDA3|nr:TetR/AcrR family transcriptional regulator [Arsenicicoccus sp. UBA7492]